MPHTRTSTPFPIKNPYPSFTHPFLAEFSADLRGHFLATAAAALMPLLIGGPHT